MNDHRPQTTILALALACALAGAARPVPATTPPDDPAPTVPVPAPDPGQPLPVPPDTVVVDLLWPTPGGGRLVGAQPDTLLLGQPCRLVFTDLPAVLPDSLPLPAWLEPVGVEPAPDPAGARALVVRPYRLGPFRVRAGGEVSPVVLVRGRLADAQATTPVREPRRAGWNPLALLLLLAAAAVVTAIAWWLARRRWGGGALGRDRQPVPAAWPRTALDLEQLLGSGFAADGERVFLDGFTALVRSHVARRFLVHGREMTAEEIGTACARLGYEQPAARPFVRLVDEADRRRYDPEPVSEAFCLEQVALFLEAVAAVRIAPAAGSLPGDELAAGEAAWRRLRAEYALAGARGGA